MENSRFKFRAWHKKWNLMATEIEIGSTEAQIIVGNTGDILDINDEYSNLAFMQLTGLHDKNGKEIYESDIVHFKQPDVPLVVSGNGYLDTDIEEGFELKGEIKFLYGCWFIDECDGNGCPLDFDEKQIVEVIGNIYENPELLEQTS